MAYRGITARLPIGFQGFTGTQNPSQAGPGHFVFVEGAELDGGIIRKDGGASLYNSANPVHGGLLDSFTKILLHMNGDDGRVAFPDTSGIAKLWTAAGNAQIDTAQSKFGGSSGLFDGTGDWISAPDSADFVLATSDFTIETWFNCNAAGGTAMAIAGHTDAGFTDGWIIRRETTNVIAFYVQPTGGGPFLLGTTQFTNAVNTGWHHVAVVRSGNTWVLYLDGVAEATATNASSVTDSSSTFQIGARGSNDPWLGWIGEFRLSIGIARWLSDFSTLTAAYADYTTEPSRAIVVDINTKILLHFDGTDASTTAIESAFFARTWTAVGNAQLDNVQSRFGGTSALFDGTGDQFTAPDSIDFTLATSDFTIDLWFFCNAAGGTSLVLCGQVDAAGGSNANSAWYISREVSNAISFHMTIAAVDTTIVTSTSTFTNAVNTGWHHLAVTRIGNDFRLFIDGVQEAFATNANSINNSTSVFGVGGGGNFTGVPWNGWIDEFRFVVGIAKWTVPFQPSTVPYVLNGANNQFLKFGALPTNVQQVVAGIHWPGAAGAGTQFNIIATDDGFILASTAGAFTGLGKFGLNALGLEPPPYFMFAGGEAVGSNRKLMMFSPNNQVQVAIGPAFSFANISGPPADWSSTFPTFGVLHAFRVFAGGNSSDPHRIYYSGTANHQDFAGAGSGTIAVFPGEGEKIIGGLSFRGALILWKYPQGVYVIITTDPTPTNWSVDRLTKAIGSVNQLSIVQIENDIAFLDKSGNTHLLSATNEFGDVNTSNLSNVSSMGPFMRSDVQLANAQKFVGLWYPAKRQLWQAVCQLGSSLNDLRLQTGFEGILQPTEGQGTQGGAPPRVFMSRRDIILSLWLHPDPVNGLPKPMVGDDDGFVWYMDQEARSKGYLAYPIQFQTASTDLAFVDPALATKQKNGEFLELAYEPRGDWDLTVDIFWDDVYIQTILFNMGGSGGTLGSFILDTDVLGTEGARSNRQRIEGSGRRLKIAAQNEGLNQDVSLAEFHLSFSVGDERIVE